MPLPKTGATIKPCTDSKHTDKVRAIKGLIDCLQRGWNPAFGPAKCSLGCYQPSPCGINGIIKGRGT